MFAKNWRRIYKKKINIFLDFEINPDDDQSSMNTPSISNAVAEPTGAHVAVPAKPAVAQTRTVAVTEPTGTHVAVTEPTGAHVAATAKQAGARRTVAATAKPAGAHVAATAKPAGAQTRTVAVPAKPIRARRTTSIDPNSPSSKFLQKISGVISGPISELNPGPKVIEELLNDLEKMEPRKELEIACTSLIPGLGISFSTLIAQFGSNENLLRFLTMLKSGKVFTPEGRVKFLATPFFLTVMEREVNFEVFGRKVS